MTTQRKKAAKKRPTKKKAAAKKKATAKKAAAPKVDPAIALEASEPQAGELRTLYVDIDRLAEWDDNPKPHAIDTLIDSIRRRGFKDPPKWEPELNGGAGGLVEGNGRLRALRQMKTRRQKAPRGIRVEGRGKDRRWFAPVLFGVDAANEIEAAGYGVDHNAISVAGGAFGVGGIAKLFEGEKLAVLHGAGVRSETPLFDDLFGKDKSDGKAAKPGGLNPGQGNRRALEFAEAALKRWKVKRDELWRAGEHLLACTDCRDGNLVRGLLAELAGKKESRVVLLTDPPYCSGAFQEAGKAAGTWGTIASDGLSSEGYRGLLRDALTAARPHTAYVMTDWRMWCALYQTVEAAGLSVRSMIVWNKGRPGLGGVWRPQHELIMFGSRSGGKREKGMAAVGNVIDLPRSGNHYHYTEKPIELMGALLSNDSSGGRGDFVVYDAFCGSGSTLLAAQEHGRRALGVDVEPICLAAALERLSQAGLKPEKVRKL